MVSCIANFYRVPVIVFCESYKFSERSQLDAFSHNELIYPQQANGKSVLFFNLGKRK
jgi:translation initiation factor eIF-2B subunit delta